MTALCKACQYVTTLLLSDFHFKKAPKTIAIFIVKNERKIENSCYHIVLQPLTSSKENCESC